MLFDAGDHASKGTAGSKHYRIYLQYPFEGIYLTRKESEIVKVMTGLSNRRIGEMLNMSPRTVEFYLNNIRVKFRVSSKHALEYIIRQYDLTGYIEREERRMKL